jgi:chitinase
VNENDSIENVSIAAVPPAGGDGRHLSMFRIFLVVAVVAAMIGGTAYFLHKKESEAGAATTQSWFAPYVDVTATPKYAFEDLTASGHRSAVLAFVVSALNTPCEPSWGGAYSMAGAGDALELDRRVARLRQLGGDVIVSFGGAANSELSIGCTDPTELAAAYTAVVDRYSLNAIDLDIEGSVASGPDVNQRRAQAIATMTANRAASGQPVSVWLTLPVGLSGLTAEGRDVLTSMLSAGVKPAGVNGMTMDFGEPLPAGASMAGQSELALTALQQQIQAAYAAVGTSLSDAASWQMVGATPMIGQNDVPGEVFGLDDANQLVAFAGQHQLGRLAMWSANRDRPCGPNYPDVTIVSDACSGVDQSAGQFDSVLGSFGTGQPPMSPTTTTSVSASTTASASGSAAPTTTAGVDDPATSPYAIWNTNQAYPKDSKVVWHRNVYQAKWYTQGDQPDLPVASADQTPWTLIGPVLPGDHPGPTPTLSPGTYPEWSATGVYVAGSRVLYQGVGYEAKYWTQGNVPGALPQTPSESLPWQVLTAP